MNSITSERKITGYLSPLNYQYLKGYTMVTGKSQSKVINEAVKDFFDKLPSPEKEKCLNSSKEDR